MRDLILFNDVYASDIIARKLLVMCWADIFSHVACDCLANSLAENIRCSCDCPIISQETLRYWCDWQIILHTRSSTANEERL